MCAPDSLIRCRFLQRTLCLTSTKHAANDRLGKAAEVFHLSCQALPVLQCSSNVCAASNACRRDRSAILGTMLIISTVFARAFPHHIKWKEEGEINRDLDLPNSCSTGVGRRPTPIAITRSADYWQARITSGLPRLVDLRIAPRCLCIFSRLP
jgi:hypothetical protein